MARLLNDDVLPPGYYAIPFLDREGPFEIDVATMREFETPGPVNEPGNGHAWTPSAPALTVAVEWPSLEDIRVEVFVDDGDPRLAAAVELVSPRNKDRPRAREAFVFKCADHLRRGCGVVVVDVVTTRRAELHAELLTALRANSVSTPSGSLSANSYWSVGHGGAGQLLIWPAALEIGQPLPTVPLWLGTDLAVPLNLEASHAAACVDLRIREAG